MGVVMNASEDKETESSRTRDQGGENRRLASLGLGVVILFVVGLVFVLDMVQSPVPEQTTIASPTTTIASPTTTIAPELSTGASLTPMWQAVEHLEDAYGDRLDRPELATAALAFLKGVSEASLDPQDPLEPIPEGVPTGFEQVWQLWRKIELEKTEIESRDLMVQTIEAMVERTGDPGAAVLVDVTVEPDGYVEDALYGIGAFVVPVEGLVVISQPFPGSPASKAGIRPGDVIREVDGVSIAGIDLEEVANLIRGPAGTTVSLVLQRAGSDPVEVEVTRETLELGTARFTMHPGGIGYLSVNSLEARTAAEVHDILESLKRRDTRALILDLRGNSGGSPGAALAVAGEFLDGEIAYVEEHLDGTRTAHPADSGGLGVDFPMVILINDGTAAEAELLAAALRYHERGPLFGSPSDGKATLYRGYELGEGVVIVTRSGRWLIPGGDSVERGGLLPDQQVTLTSDDLAAGFDRPQAAANAYLWTLLQGAA